MFWEEGVSGIQVRKRENMANEEKEEKFTVDTVELG